MAARDQSGRVAHVAGASLPIAPTAIVATVDVTRPSRAAQMTYAAFSGRGDKPAEAPPSVLAYASPEAGFVPEKPRALRTGDFGARATAPIRASASVQAETPFTTESNLGVAVDTRLYA